MGEMEPPPYQSHYKTPKMEWGLETAGLCRGLLGDVQYRILWEERILLGKTRIREAGASTEVCALVLGCGGQVGFSPPKVPPPQPCCCLFHPSTDLKSIDTIYLMLKKKITVSASSL